MGRVTTSAGFVLAALLLLTGCSSPGADRANAQDDGLVLPTLTVRHRALAPSSYGYRLDGRTTRNTQDEQAARQRVEVPKRERLRLRLVSGFPARLLYVGTFARVDARGRPVDGGDQYDCLTGPACRQTPRAGSLSIEVPIQAATTLIVVRSRFEVPGRGAVDVVWRFALRQT